MKNINRLLTASLLLSGLLGSCKDEESPQPDEPGIQITGTLTAPDGKTPISYATVFVPSGTKTAVIAESPVQNNLDCPAPTVDNLGYTCTNADGSFSFTISEPLSNKITLSASSGAFSFNIELDVEGGQMDLGKVIMPTNDQLETRIAVVTGFYDRMQDVLAKLGFGEIDENGQLIPGTEKFDLFSGIGYDEEEHPLYSELFTDGDGDGKADLFNYKMLFINCGANEGDILSAEQRHGHQPKTTEAFAENRNEVLALNPENIALLKTFVEQGGTLYTTDWAYDFIESTFPSKINFMGSNATPESEPEEADAAESGKSGISTDGMILQNPMNAWFANVACNDGSSGCLNSDGTVHITDFLPGWAVINAVKSPDVTVWIKGEITYNDDETFDDVTTIKPLTVSFKAGKGTVVYSSYHTIESSHSPYFRPQERVLQYLVFE